MNKASLTSDSLLAGVDVAVDLGSGAILHGQVSANAFKNMIWIPKETGSNIPGRWVAEDSPEAKAAPHHNANAMSVEAVRQIQR